MKSPCCKARMQACARIASLLLSLAPQAWLPKPGFPSLAPQAPAHARRSRRNAVACPPPPHATAAAAIGFAGGDFLVVAGGGVLRATSMSAPNSAKSSPRSPASNCATSASRAGRSCAASDCSCAFAIGHALGFGHPDEHPARNLRCVPRGGAAEAPQAARASAAGGARAGCAPAAARRRSGRAATRRSRRGRAWCTSSCRSFSSGPCGRRAQRRPQSSPVGHQ